MLTKLSVPHMHLIRAIAMTRRNPTALLVSSDASLIEAVRGVIDRSTTSI